MRKGEGGGEGGQVEEVLTRQLNKLEKRTAPKIVQSVKCEPAAAVGSPVRLSSYRHSISTLTHTAQSALCSTQIAIQSVRLPDCLLTAFSAFSSKGVQKKTHTLVTWCRAEAFVDAQLPSLPPAKETNEVQIIDMSMQCAVFRALVPLSVSVCVFWPVCLLQWPFQSPAITLSRTFRFVCLSIYCRCSRLQKRGNTNSSRLKAAKVAV